MAAPPIPPKGGSTSWMGEERVADHTKWVPATQNAFSSSATPASAAAFPPFNFDGNLFNHCLGATSQGFSAPPPLPPRRQGETIWPATERSSSEFSELSLVPPPPSLGQSFKTKEEISDLIELSASSVHKGTKVSFDATGSTTTSNFATFPNALSYQPVRAPAFTFVSRNEIFSAPRPLLFYNASALSFSNSAYQSSIRPFVPQGFDIQHSHSAPNLANCKTVFASGEHRLSLPSGQQSNQNAARPATQVTSDACLKTPVKQQQIALENVLKFMKKKRDSNLIDLYCGDDVLKSSKLSGTRKSQDDILKLFDPLSEAIVETVEVPEEQENGVPEETSVNSGDFSSDTFVKEVYSEISKNQSSADLGLKGSSSCKNQTEMYDAEEMQLGKGLSSVIKIKPCGFSCTDEIRDFCEKLRALRSEFSYDDHPTNVGLVISPTLDSYQEDTLSIKLIIHSRYSERAISFTCDVNTSIEHIISHTVCTIFEETASLSMDNFVLKVRGLAEYFSAHSTLSDYEYVHQCHKFDKPVCLTLMDIGDLRRPLARTKVDDFNDVDFKLSDVAPDHKKGSISHETLSILLETLEKEIEKLKECALKSGSRDALCPQGAVQAVKAICTLLSHVETSDITDSVSSLIHICLLFGKSEGRDFDFLPELTSLCNSQIPLQNESKDKFHNLFQLLELSLLHLQQAIQRLLLMYSRTFGVDFEVESLRADPHTKSVTDFLDTLLFHVGIVHRLPPSYLSLYEHYSIVCEIYHGEHSLASVTSKNVQTSKSFFHRICFEEWIQFETISMCTLPREAVLRFTLRGLSNPSADGNQKQKCVLGWCAVRLFTSRKELCQGNFLLGFWPSSVPLFSGPAMSNPGTKCPLLQISLPEFDCTVTFPPVIDNKFASSHIRNFDSLDASLKSLLVSIMEHDILHVLKPDEKELLWEKRHYLHEFPQALPKVLLSAHGWDWACLSDIYSLLKEWTPLSPVDSLDLLLPCFPDEEVRRTAIRWMKDIVSDELCDLLPQMVQVLRYEAWEDSPTAWFLLERSLTSVRVAHHLYWLLKQHVDDPVSGQRMQLVLKALLTISGKAMRNRIETQEALLENLSTIAEKVKTTKESLRLGVLCHELEVTHHDLQENNTCLPLSPSLEVCGVDVKSCSYFTSNTLPLKIIFHSPELDSKNIEAIYKAGDDLRQDMITLQMIRIMDKLWLKEGLDLKIVTFMCIATEHRKGMVELVPESETLRKIQTELGLTGSFKDRSIAEWLQKHNTSELEYQQAVDNFTLSCAGYCVATYVLGICDRHNDNIMLKTSGHIFHIDFGKFLGDAQMFGNIKRDRTPFVLTSDMAYVINGGDKPSKKFQYFIDLCCQAFNIVRKHKNIFFGLFTLMTNSGIPGMSRNAAWYVQRALLPGLSEAEATAQFTRMIQESLKSWFTQFNFFIHNLAQLRFTGDHNEGLLLSFIPKTFSKETDGKITSVSVVGCKKMYDPEKYYAYTIKIDRENLPVSMYVFRNYREFIEFHQKLCVMFPLAKFHPLPGNPLMGRSNVREVAEKRKSEIGIFLRSLMVMAEEISHCDLVYTFFHPLLRDQEGMAEEKEVASVAGRSRRSSSVGPIKGQVKLSILYKNNSLFIMIMHAKNLSSPKGTAPDPYVKTYLLPDPYKMTKRKTKTVSKNCHPTFMEMLVYDLPLEVVRHRNLHVSVWDYDRVQENEFLGATMISLGEGDLSREKVQWYPLGNFIS